MVNYFTEREMCRELNQLVWGQCQHEIRKNVVVSLALDESFGRAQWVQIGNYESQSGRW